MYVKRYFVLYQQREIYIFQFNVLIFFCISFVFVCDALRDVDCMQSCCSDAFDRLVFCSLPGALLDHRIYFVGIKLDV